MPSRTRHSRQERRERRQHKTIAEDERGWAGQHGQRPSGREETNYRPSGGKLNPKSSG